MNALPFLQKVISADAHFLDKPPKVGTLYTYAPDNLGFAMRSKKIDLRLPRTGNVNIRWLMIGGLDDEPEAMCAVNDIHRGK